MQLLMVRLFPCSSLFPYNNNIEKPLIWPCHRKVGIQDVTNSDVALSGCAHRRLLSFVKPPTVLELISPAWRIFVDYLRDILMIGWFQRSPPIRS